MDKLDSAVAAYIVIPGHLIVRNSTVQDMGRQHLHIPSHSGTGSHPIYTGHNINHAVAIQH